MKKLIFLSIFLFSFLSYSQYRVSTEGESKTFVFEDLSDNSLVSYPREYITARIMSSGNIIVFRNDGSNDGESFAFSQSGGIAYTEFRNGNDSDSTFNNAEAVVQWFYDNTGFKTASGGSGASLSKDFYVKTISSKDTITDADFISSADNIGLLFRITTNDTLIPGIISSSNYYKPFYIQSVNDSAYFKIKETDDLYREGSLDTIPAQGVLIRNRNVSKAWFENETTLFIDNKNEIFEEVPYIGDNAIDPLDEVNALGDVAYENPADGSASVIEGDAVHGSYFIRGANNGNDSDCALRVSLADSNLEIGKSYKITVWAREFSGGSATLYISSGFVDQGNSFGSIPATWDKFSFISEVDGADPGFAIYDGSNNDGDLFDYDFVTIEKIEN